ncbi:MAG: hypothetical protein K2Y28_02785, partial [Burkholderiaceae bacterium]|nr:hypothetical protein [Burkholderiaceae bacterium]
MTTDKQSETFIKTVVDERDEEFSNTDEPKDAATRRKALNKAALVGAASLLGGAGALAASFG